MTALVHSALLAARPDMRILEVRGSDMDPTFRTGDRVVVDLGQDRVRFDAIYAVAWAGHDNVMLRRVQRLVGGGLLLLSDNAMVDAVEIPRGRKGEIVIVGRVVGHFREL